MKKLFIYISVFFLLPACENNRNANGHNEKETALSSGEIPAINFDHLDYLYKDLTLPNGRKAGIIHIYSNYPDYSYDVEPLEGFTCVDDVARAVILFSGEKELSNHLIPLIEFLLYMQNKNGWFNNFMWKDLSINTTYKTSVAEPNWWSWRALWALEKALPIMEIQNPELAERMKAAVNLLLDKIKVYLSSLKQSNKQIKGVSIATNLPHESATDQASVLLIGLNHYYQRSGDTTIKIPMKQLADGILKMQIKNGPLEGMFLSWENLWHAYGNTQSYALLLTGKLLKENIYTKAALHEIDSFFPYLQKKGFLEMMTVQSNNQTVVVLNEKVFPQIAYGIRPIVYAYVEAYKQTGNKKYKESAFQWVSWLSGKNTASTIMYHPETGRCYDGIKSGTGINQNSGAESTIEALLCLQSYNSIKEF